MPAAALAPPCTLACCCQGVQGGCAAGGRQPASGELLPTALHTSQKCDVCLRPCAWVQGAHGTMPALRRPRRPGSSAVVSRACVAPVSPPLLHAHAAPRKCRPTPTVRTQAYLSCTTAAASAGALLGLGWRRAGPGRAGPPVRTRRDGKRRARAPTSCRFPGRRLHAAAVPRLGSSAWPCPAVPRLAPACRCRGPHKLPAPALLPPACTRCKT